MAYSLVQGDLGADLVVTLAVQAAIDALATAQSVQLRWEKPDGTVSLVTMTVDNATTGIVRRTWVSGDTDQVGLHRGQVVVTSLAGDPVTDPNDGSFLEWNIYKQLPY